MGQRLNIEIIREGNLLTNAYYHWSGYTSSAITLSKLALSEWEESPSQSIYISLEKRILSICEEYLKELEKEFEEL